MNKVLEPPIVPDSNKHVKEYLSYYVSFPHSPHFAVLLNGTWGIGKTFLVEKYLKTLEKHGKKFVYISLYGLASIDEINDALFRSLYPKLVITHRHFRRADQGDAADFGAPLARERNL